MFLELAELCSSLSTSNPEQDLLRHIGIQPILVHAPAGCGKTHALADRAHALIAAGAIRPPHRILALTFSNRAKTNLAARMRDRIGPRYWRYVTVTNFHGLGARLIRSHGEVINLSPALKMPERGWRQRALRSLSVDWRNAPAVEEALRDAKADAVSDEEVRDRLQASGSTEAVAFQELLDNDTRLDFADLLRHAERVLREEDVSRLYSLHFPAVFVDELQDLTVQQFRLAELIGKESLTAVGDKTQGIYAFAGADVSEILTSMKKKNPAQISFKRSYRSAPKVLEAVSLVAGKLGGLELECANPQDWQTEGTIALLKRSSPEEEAEEVLDRANQIFQDDDHRSVGIIARRGSRAEAILAAASSKSLDLNDWGNPTHTPAVVALLRRFRKEASAAATDAETQMATLEAMCRAEVPEDDPELLDELIAAVESLADMMQQGANLEQAVAQCRQAPPADAPIPPGLHVLSGHVGKGQQFDWVFVIGLEEGHIPDFRATSPIELEEELRILHVMISRAREGVVLTAVQRTQDQYLRWHTQTPCRWLPDLEGLVSEHW
jgi:DNA helicase II / ATP-dependent DNA helicase PcrA